MGSFDIDLAQMRLPQFLAGIDPLTLRDAPFEVMTDLVTLHLDRLPLPGKGQTWARWHALAQVSGRDLRLGRLFESHSDALAILAELGEPEPDDETRWGVWCAECHEQRVLAWPEQGRTLRLNGTRSGCAGALHLTHALIGARTLAGERILASVALEQPGVVIDGTAWPARPRSSAHAATVHFENVAATLVGAHGQYLNRPGFSHGGAGVAACWYGAASAIANYMRDHLPQPCDGCRSTQLGLVDAHLDAALGVLRECAQRIDAQPGEAGLRESLYVRLVVEEVARKVISVASRALGSKPLCTDPWYARMMTDLPVYVRQTHAECDLARMA